MTTTIKRIMRNFKTFNEEPAYAGSSEFSKNGFSLTDDGFWYYNYDYPNFMVTRGTNKRGIKIKALTGRDRGRIIKTVDTLSDAIDFMSNGGREKHLFL